MALSIGHCVRCGSEELAIKSNKTIQERIRDKLYGSFCSGISWSSNTQWNEKMSKEEHKKVREDQGAIADAVREELLEDIMEIFEEYKEGKQ